MSFIDKRKENLRFWVFLLLSTILNLMIFLIPSCNDIIKRENLQYENIRTGLISVIDTEKEEHKKDLKEAVTNKDSISEKMIKKEEKEISTINNESKTQNTENIPTDVAKFAVNNNGKPLPKFVGPVRKDSNVEGLLATTNTTKTLKQKVDGVFENSGKSLNNSDLTIKGTGLKGIDTENKEFKSSTKDAQIGNFEKNAIGIGKDNSSISTNESIKFEINDTGVATSIPKNVSYNLIDTKGGRVIFRKYVDPIYPAEAQKNGWNGDVEVEFSIIEGRTNFLGIVSKSGYSVIDRAVERAAKNWLLTIEKNGQSINGKVRVKVEFNF